MDDFYTFILKQRVKAEKNSRGVRELYTYLMDMVNSKKIKENSLTVSQHVNGACSFRVYFNNASTNSQYDGISLAKPIDMCWDGYETALLSQDNLTYVNDVGYDDVCRFETKQEVVDEVLRLYEYLNKAVDELAAEEAKDVEEVANLLEEVHLHVGVAPPGGLVVEDDYVVAPPGGMVVDE